MDASTPTAWVRPGPRGFGYTPTRNISNLGKTWREAERSDGIVIRVRVLPPVPAFIQQEAPMTTVAWDGQTLAGDTLGVVAGYLRQRARKVHKLPDGRLIGGAGNYAELLQVLVWLTDDESEEPSLEDFAGLLVQPDGRAFVFSEDRVMIPLLEARYAIGSGRDFALSAMWYGATAAEAVRHASQFDVWTGPEVEIIQL